MNLTERWITEREMLWVFVGSLDRWEERRSCTGSLLELPPRLCFFARLDWQEVRIRMGTKILRIPPLGF